MDCIFCKIIDREIPSTIIYESDEVLAFRDIEPQAEEHILIIPKKHIASTNELTREDAPYLAGIHLAAQEVAQQLGIDQSGYRLTTNCGKDAGQVVFHLHYHLLGGEPLGPLIATRK